MPKGGYRKGAGRPPLDPLGKPRKAWRVFVTDDEREVLQETLDRIRETKAEASNS